MPGLTLPEGDGAALRGRAFRLKSAVDCGIILLMRLKHRAGQTMLEYVLTFSALLVAIGALGYLVRSTKSSVVRTERLVGSEYP